MNARLAALLVLSTACTSFAPRVPSVVFVRDGIIAPTGDGQSLSDGRVVIEKAWRPGDTFQHGEKAFTAPAQASCVSVASRDLADLNAWIARGGAADGDVRFAPDGRWLAVATTTGDLNVLDGWTLSEQASRTIADGFARELLVSRDGATLFAATQAPHAAVLALDPMTLETRWSLDLTPFIGSAPPPAPNDPFGRYSLPAAYDLALANDGSLYVAASLGRRNADGVRVNKGVLLHVGVGGTLLGRWPRDGDIAVMVQQLRVDGDRLAVLVHHTADTPLPEGMPTGGVLLFDRHTLTLQHTIAPDPITAYDARVWVWEAFDLQRDTLWLGLTDGRVFAFDAATGQMRWQRDPGAPRPIAGTLVASSVAWGFLGPDAAFALTSASTIPWRDAAPGATPPAVHPGEESVVAYDPHGKPRFAWHVPGAHPQGLLLANKGRDLIVGGGLVRGSLGTGPFGAWILDPSAKDPRHQTRAHCPTLGPVHFRMDATDDGRIALVELPRTNADGETVGAYRLHVMR